MFCGKCRMYIKGVVNKARHILATEDKKLDYDEKRWREYPIDKAKEWLSQKIKLEEDGRQVFMTQREYYFEKVKPFIRINKRNHGEKSHGSDLYR